MHFHRFEHCSELPLSAQELFAWHEQPNAFDRLLPPWEKVKIIKAPNGLQKGETGEFLIKYGPFWMKWSVEHSEFEQGRLFVDRQTRGPFSFWEHRHEFLPVTDHSCTMRDQIQYALPLGGIGNWIFEKKVHDRLQKTFHYRHQILKTDLKANLKTKGSSIRTILITGANGFVGSSLCPFLEMAGLRVIPVSRKPGKPGRSVQWDPETAPFPPQALEEVDGVIHLAGESIATGWWTRAKKNRIMNSRVLSTQKIATALANSPNSVQVFLCASAIGAYGSRPDETLTEESTLGTGFLAEVCKHWEEATIPARMAGKRVISMRFGVILSLLGGALPELLFPFRMRLGSYLGASHLHFSWIALDDLLHAILHLLLNQNPLGSVNLTSPNPVSNAEFIKTLETVLTRKAWFPIPPLPLKLLLGQKANELLFSDLKVLPQGLQKNGYEYLYPTLEEALRHLLGKYKPD